MPPLRPLTHDQESTLAQLERVSTTKAVRARVAAWREAGQRVALVPTMGNLHAGHLSLLDAATLHADRIVVTIFVNPTQFSPNEDIDSYPRTPAADVSLLDDQGATDLLFVPNLRDIYPRDTAETVAVTLPSLAQDLCGRSRPGHFNGVASVVLRLLNIVRPDALVMGRKDYQQLILLTRMIEDLHIDVELVSSPTIREPDGLAMSSRNQYLTSAEREIAPQLYATLGTLAQVLRDDTAHFEERRATSLAELRSAGFRPEYLELRFANDLTAAAAEDRSRERVLLAAAWLGRARLIDNVFV